MSGGNQPLPSKEAALFKQLVKLYEDKQCKKAIKVADQILKKFPEHGETLAMKGLTLSTIGPEKKEEAFNLVRTGLKADLKSHVCWHVYGLLYRTMDKDYKEAAKCYQCALRIEPDNVQILRDLATLQIQMRDLAGFAESRQRLLALKPSNRSNWITFALAQHVNKAYDIASKVLDSYESTLQEIPASEAYEHSELLLYKALLLDEGGSLEDALNVLDTQKDKLKDKLGMLEHRASLLLRLGRLKEAEAQYRDLLALNPDHYRWHEGLQATLGLRPVDSMTHPATGTSPAGVTRLSLGSLQMTDEQRAGLQALYQELAAAYPRSSACQRIPLDFLQGDAFQAAADAYVRKYLRKGIPSLFIALKPLYSDPAKAAALGQLFESYHASLKATSSFPAIANASSNGHADQPSGEQESPLVHVWVLYYLAQHYDHLRNHTHALALLEEACNHTPTLIELHTTKSKLLQHAGDMDGAAQAAEVARRGDLSDRYLNSMAVKALLRANKVDAAEKTAALFTRDTDGPGGGITALYDMQHMWFETKAGAAHMRLKEHGKALKKFTAVLKHFEDIHEDQFDFHGYCVRKTTLRAYVTLLRWEDTLYGHNFYLKAAAGAIKTYLELADKPTAAQQEAAEEALLASMTPEERKKYKLKKKKEEKRSANEAAARAAEAAAKQAAAREGQKQDGKDKKKGQPAAEKKEKDDDPHGEKLAACEDPLGAATKLVVSLKQHSPEQLDTHLLAAQVYCRRGKLLLALAAVQHAVRLGGVAHPDVHQAVIKFCLTASAAGSTDQPAAHAAVSQLLTQGISALLQGASDVQQYNSQWVSAHGQTSLAHRVAAAKCLLQLGSADTKPQAAALVLGAATPTGHAPGTHAECVAAGELLSSPPIADAAASEQWQAACKAAFPYSRHFNGASVVPLDQGFDFDNVVEAFGRLSF